MTSNSHLGVPENDWEQEAKAGVYSTLSHCRKILQRGGTFTNEERDGLIEMLLLVEEWVGMAWEPNMIREGRRHENKPEQAPSIQEQLHSTVEKGRVHGDNLVAALATLQQTMQKSHLLLAELEYNTTYRKGTSQHA